MGPCGAPVALRLRRIDLRLLTQAARPVPRQASQRKVPHGADRAALIVCSLLRAWLGVRQWASTAESALTPGRSGAALIYIWLDSAKRWTSAGTSTRHRGRLGTGKDWYIIG